MIEGVTFIVHWLAQATACQKCAMLHGREWTMDDLEEIPLILMTLEHPNGKCELDVDLDVDLERLQIG